MTLKLMVPETRELRPCITVFGIGGAGGNAVNNMIDAGLEGVEFVAANTDAQALGRTNVSRRIQMGTENTQGLGAGARPEVGCSAAEAALPEICEALQGADMVFITAGMGGGTGTGAAPVIARAAQEAGILTVGVVTKPFRFEGARRIAAAEEGIAEMRRHVDTLLIIPNQNLFLVADEKTTFADAFGMADRVLHAAVSGIVDLMIKPGLINLDYADLATVMRGMGPAMMGTGEAAGEERAMAAAEAAIDNPLLDNASMAGAGGLLINITGGEDMTLHEVDRAATRISAEVDPAADIIVGSTFSEDMAGAMRITVIATGIGGVDAARPARAPESGPRVRQVHPAPEAAPPTVPPMAPVTGPVAPQVRTLEQTAPVASTAPAEAPATAPATAPAAAVAEAPAVAVAEAPAVAVAEAVTETSASVADTAEVLAAATTPEETRSAAPAPVPADGSEQTPEIQDAPPPLAEDAVTQDTQDTQEAQEAQEAQSVPEAPDAAPAPAAGRSARRGGSGFLERLRNARRARAGAPKAAAGLTSLPDEEPAGESPIQPAAATAPAGDPPQMPPDDAGPPAPPGDHLDIPAFLRRRGGSQ